MIFRLGNSIRACDTDAGQVLAQARKRPLIQEAGEVIGSVGQKFAAPDTDEKIEEFALDFAGVCVCGGFGEFAMGNTEWRFIPMTLADLRKQVRVGRPRQQSCQECVFLCAGAVDVVDTRLVIQIRPQDCARDAARVLDLKNALRGHFGPVGNGWLGNSNAARKFGDAADGADSLLESPVNHGLPWLLL
jgi:hypothetical protein